MFKQVLTYSFHSQKKVGIGIGLKKVLQKNVSGGSKEIDLDVTNLTRGVYIYRINGKTNKFIKE